MPECSKNPHNTQNGTWTPVVTLSTDTCGGQNSDDTRGRLSLQKATPGTGQSKLEITILLGVAA